MNSRNRRKARKLAGKALELSVAAPQVVAHRLGRMARAGGKPSARDAAEFRLMQSEKAAAFAQSWSAMAMEGLRAQQALARAVMRSWFSLTPLRGPALAALWQGATLGMMAGALRPVHQAATANARRLSSARR